MSYHDKKTWGECCGSCLQVIQEGEELAEIIRPPRALANVTGEDYVMTDSVRLLVHQACMQEGDTIA